MGLPIGISIGKNKTTPLAEAIEDYLACAPHPGAVRGLSRGERVQPEHAWSALPAGCPDAGRAHLRARRGGVAARRRRPAGAVFVKVAPDLTESALEELLGVCTDAGAEGLIATNTTLRRDGLPADRPGRRARRAVRELR